MRGWCRRYLSPFSKWRNKTLNLANMLTPSRLQSHLRRRCWQQQRPCGIITRSFAKQKAAAATAKKNKDQQAKAPVNTGRDKDLELVLAALNAPMRVEPEISAEEKARRYEIGRNHVIGRFRQHNEIHHDLACKIHLKMHAVNMLPKGSWLKEEAMKVDDEGPPRWRNLAAWTPPIPGYNPSEFVDKDD